MKTKLTILTVICTIAPLLAALASACSSGEDDEQRWARQSGEVVAEDKYFDAPAAPAPGKLGSPGQPGLPGAPGAPAPTANPQTVAAEKEVVREVQLSAPLIMSEDAARTGPVLTDTSQTQAQLVSQRRIIIRTVNMTIVVDDIQVAIDRVARIAKESGGWMVSSDRSLKHRGSISIRVPAADLDSVVQTLREMALDIESENSSSQDVTDEYFDLQSRLKNQQATEAALIRLLDRAENVEHALAVQRELSAVQENVERLLGRIKLLEETSAYSLITVSLKLAPLDIAIDAGPDQSVAAYTPTRFRATFTPPEGMEQHSISWDFGDGSEPVYIGRSAPTTVEGERVTATVTHTYGDPKDSPFIAQIRISSHGEGGSAEGEDTLIVSVSEIPVIEVFAGEGGYEALQNEVVEFSGSFTRPPGLNNVRYQWDFGDGSPPQEGELAEGTTRVDATHAYTDYRTTRYPVRFTITADSAVGEVVSSHQIEVLVREDPGLIVGGFDVGDTAKSAVRSLSLVFSGLTTVAVWVGIFGVIWAPLVVILIILIRRRRGFRAGRPPRNPRAPMPQGEPETEAN